MTKTSQKNKIIVYKGPVVGNINNLCYGRETVTINLDKYLTQTYVFLSLSIREKHNSYTKLTPVDINRKQHSLT